MEERVKQSAWPARAVGDAWLCGRPKNGEFRCDGRLALIVDLNGYRVTAYPNGYVQDPPGWFLPNQRSMKTGRKPRSKRPIADGPLGDAHWKPRAPLFETRTRCPQCGGVAIVPAEAPGP